MTAAETQKLRSLYANEVVNLGKLEMRRLVCVSGVLWVTNGRDGVDYLLNDGETLEMKDAPMVVVQALCEAEWFLESLPVPDSTVR